MSDHEDSSDSEDADYVPSGGESDVEIPPEDDVEKEPEVDEEAEKKKADSIWASFMSDVGGSVKKKDAAKNGSSNSSLVSAVKKPPAKVVINKTFDFAGEKVTVEKEVAADSKEAKSVKTVPSTDAETKPSEVKTNISQVVGGIKRKPGGLASIMGKITDKKPKMSVLTKTQLDWKEFKSQENINEELDSYKKSKEGYLNKQDFLERTDLRQFEIEKSLREVNRKTKR